MGPGDDAKQLPVESSAERIWIIHLENQWSELKTNFFRKELIFL